MYPFFISYGIIKRKYKVFFFITVFLIQELSLNTSSKLQTQWFSVHQFVYYMFFILCTLMAFYSNYLLYQYIQNKQEKIQESKSFKELLDLLPDGIVLINHDMKAVYQNKVFEKRVLKMGEKASHQQEQSDENTYRVASEDLDWVFQLNVKILLSKEAEMNPLPMQKE